MSCCISLTTMSTRCLRHLGLPLAVHEMEVSGPYRSCWLTGLRDGAPEARWNHLPLRSRRYIDQVPATSSLHVQVTLITPPSIFFLLDRRACSLNPGHSQASPPCSSAAALHTSSISTCRAPNQLSRGPSRTTSRSRRPAVVGLKQRHNPAAADGGEDHRDAFDVAQRPRHERSSWPRVTLDRRRREARKRRQRARQRGARNIWPRTGCGQRWRWLVSGDGELAVLSRRLARTRRRADRRRTRSPGRTLSHQRRLRAEPRFPRATGQDCGARALQATSRSRRVAAPA